MTKLTRKVTPLTSLLIAVLFMASAEVVVTQNRVGSWMEGAWDGNYTEEMWRTGSLRLIVEGDQYTVQYHLRGCEGSWSVIDRGEKKFKFIERLKPTSADKICQDGGEVTIEPVDATRLRYSYKPPNSKKTTLVVVLRRIRMDIAKPPPPPQYDKTGHRTSELLLEAPKYKVYAQQYGSVCLDNMGVVSIVYDVPAEEPIDYSVETFMREIAPMIAEKCRGGRYELDRFLVHYYLKNVWFFDAAPYMEEGPIERTEKMKSQPFIQVQYARRLDDRTVWENTRTTSPFGVVGQLGLFIYRNEGGRPASPIRWSLSLYRQKLAEMKAADAVSAAKEKERLAEEARLAPIRAQERLKKEREANIAGAAPVLRFYKRGAPEQYDFTGYETKNFMQSIYSGNFEPFTGGHRTYNDWKSSTIHSGFGNADVRNPLGFLLNLVDTAGKASEVSGRRDALALSYYVYHITYREQCGTDKEMPWGISALEFYLTRDDVEVEGSRTKGNVYSVREPFRAAFNDAYGTVGNTNNVSPYIPPPIQNDFRKFLKQEGCASPAVRFFETNLYLAMRWQLPLQDLKDYLSSELLKPATTPAEKPTAAPPTKTKPPVKESRPAPRRRG